MELQEQNNEQITTETVAVYPAEENNMPYDIVIERIPSEAPAPEVGNFRITDDHLGKGGAKAKFRANMDAINLLKELEFDGRQATEEEQEILSKYVGWGSLPDAFDESKENWADEFQELYTALSPDEYKAAKASVLNAHYTSPTVIRAIYEAVENMGFTKGNILEPSMGVGNFFGLLPESMSSSNLYGVELDKITGKIAKQLYPKADITVAGFETTDRRDFYDLAVGNVPFGQYQVSDKAYNKLGFPIHDYFIAKAIDQVRPGGVIAFVTSRYTMDVLTLKGKMTHRVTLGKDPRGNLMRIENAFNNIEKRLETVKERLDALYVQVENAKAELGKPFPQEEELRTKSARLAELNAELNINDRTPMEQAADNIEAEKQPTTYVAKSEKPPLLTKSEKSSLLAKLKRPLPSNKPIEAKNNELEGR